MAGRSNTRKGTQRVFFYREETARKFFLLTRPDPRVQASPTGDQPPLIFLGLVFFDHPFERFSIRRRAEKPSKQEKQIILAHSKNIGSDGQESRPTP